MVRSVETILNITSTSDYLKAWHCTTCLKSLRIQSVRSAVMGLGEVRRNGDYLGEHSANPYHTGKDIVFSHEDGVSAGGRLLHSVDRTCRFADENERMGARERES